MSITLIVISKNANAQPYIDNILSYNMALSDKTTVIYPTESQSETSLVTPLLNTSEGAFNLIIYDWSKSLILTPNISSILSSIITKMQTLSTDITYLGKYLDTCSKYSINSNIENIQLVSGTEPIGFNAVLMSSSFSQKLKNELEANQYSSIMYGISNLGLTNTINSLATSPNMFIYNPLYNSIDTSNSYSVKTTECQPLSSQMTPPSDNSLTIFWILLIFFVIAVIFILVVNFTNIFESPLKDVYPQYISQKEL